MAVVGTASERFAHRGEGLSQGVAQILVFDERASEEVVPSAAYRETSVKGPSEALRKPLEIGATSLFAALQFALDQRPDNRNQRKEEDDAETEERDRLIARGSGPALAVLGQSRGSSGEHQQEDGEHGCGGALHEAESIARRARKAGVPVHP